MAAITLDHLSSGRAVLGLGPSGPQVAEGWYGRAFGRPVETASEYVDIVRQVLRRDRPVALDGGAYRLPLPGSVLGKPLRTNLAPLRSHLPIHFGAEGPRMIALAAELCDGLHVLFYSPSDDAWYREALAAGFSRRGETPEGFEVVATAHVCIDDDVEAAANRLRPVIALYVGGMGAPGANFHNNVFARRGWEAEAARSRSCT